MSALSDAAGLAVVGVVGLVAVEYVKNAGTISNAAQSVVNTATNKDQSVSWQIAGASPGDYCGAIANWRSTMATAPLAGGILGFGAFDPNSWSQFVAYCQTIGIPVPSSQPPCWFGQNPSIGGQQYGPYGPEGY